MCFAVCVQSTALALGRMLFMAVTAVRALQGNSAYTEERIYIPYTLCMHLYTSLVLSLHPVIRFLPYVPLLLHPYLVSCRELAFFFPKFCVPWVPGTEPPIQRTLAIIRPAAYNEHKGGGGVRSSGVMVAHGTGQCHSNACSTLLCSIVYSTNCMHQFAVRSVQY